MKKIKYIAELCQNHNGKEKNLDEMLDRCVESGADYVKLQYIFSKNLVFRPIFESGLNKGKKILSIKRPFKEEYNRLKKIELQNKDYEKFVTKCEKFGVKPMITCFSRDSINVLYNMVYKNIKIASYDCASLQLLREVSSKFDFILVSTGATFDDEIKSATKILSSSQYALLHCVTLYPTPLHEFHLSRMKFLQQLKHLRDNLVYI